MTLRTVTAASAARQTSKTLDGRVGAIACVDSDTRPDIHGMANQNELEPFHRCLSTAVKSDEVRRREQAQLGAGFLETRSR